MSLSQELTSAAGTGLTASGDVPLSTLVELRDAMRVFVSERGWEKFHTPRNLLLALAGEVGELAEIFRWEGELERGLPTFSREKTQHLGEELADVLLFLVRMSDVCGVDLAAAAAQKMRKNRTNYPRERCFGSAAKHTAYRAEGGAGAGGGGSAGSGSGGAGSGSAGGGGNGGGRSWALEVPVVLLGLAAPLTIVGAWVVISALRAARPA